MHHQHVGNAGRARDARSVRSADTPSYLRGANTPPRRVARYYASRSTSWTLSTRLHVVGPEALAALFVLAKGEKKGQGMETERTRVASRVSSTMRSRAGSVGLSGMKGVRVRARGVILGTRATSGARSGPPECVRRARPRAESRAPKPTLQGVLFNSQNYRRETSDRVWDLDDDDDGMTTLRIQRGYSSRVPRGGLHYIEQSNPYLNNK